MALRLFAAIGISDEAAEAASRLARGVAGARWRPRDNLHLTLAFFGDVAEPAARDLDAELELVAAGVPAFTMRLKGAGFFGGERPHALWLGVEPLEIAAQLAAGCQRAARRAGLSMERRKFAPHMTIASLSGTTTAQAHSFVQRCNLFQSPAWDVASFGLWSSVVRPDAPSLYREEAVYPLAPPTG